ncbi:tetraspanin-15-like isoform X1 [Tachypleus tridentatus]|uniref:tetraspanin-15-like isoform X1 n=1 Tax=Tachypleus tridentatus TaxID=6853 RepID=UPI003FD0B65E
MSKVTGVAQHIVSILSLSLWVLGGAIIGYTMWVLGTSAQGREFFSGKLLFTYVTLCLGAFLFVGGLLGSIGSYRKGGCLLNTFLCLSVVSVATEVGGIVALNILKTKVADILSQMWSEVNQATRNVLQEKKFHSIFFQFHCCGFLGPKEFAYNSKMIDDSCYFSETSTDNTVVITEKQVLKRVGCKEFLVDWFYENKVVLIISLGTIILIQVINILIAVYLVNQKKPVRRTSSVREIQNHSHV